MVSLIRQMGHDNEGEVDVRRLQRMLEETLTKNMHLQVRNVLLAHTNGASSRCVFTGGRGETVARGRASESNSWLVERLVNRPSFIGRVANESCLTTLPLRNLLI